MTITPGRLEAFPQQFPFPEGLDLGRSVLGRSLGVFEADPNATFRAGMIVARNSTGLIIPCVSDDPIGVAKWNKSLFLKSVVVDEQVTLTGVGAHNLKHANVENVKVTDLTGVTTYTVTTDYTINATNGTITRVGTGSIADGETVLVTYAFQLTESDLDFQGRNFFNFIDDVSIAQGRITVIQGLSTLFTTQYDTGRTYAINEDLHCGGTTAALTGLFTNDSGEGDYVGKVMQLPTATDSYLGVEWMGPSQ